MCGVLAGYGCVCKNLYVCVIRLVFRGKTGFVFLVVKRFEESVVKMENKRRIW